MYTLKTNQLEPDKLCWQLLVSIRTIDTQLTELRDLISSLPKNTTQRKTLRERVERLVDTRFKLVYSFIDIIGAKESSVFKTLNPTYHELKRSISYNK